VTRTGRNSLCLAVALAIGGGLAAVSLAVPTEVRGPVTADVPADRLAPPTTAPTNSPTIGGCSIYPADNAWNMRVDTLALRAGSAATIAKIQAVGGDNLHPDFGENPEYGIPFVVVAADQPLVPITYTEAGDESDPGPFPIPLDAPVEGGNGSSGDRHVIALQQGTCQLYELYSSYRSGGGWEAYSGAKFDLTSNVLRPLGWTSADAAGLPILPGLVRYDEVAAGVINHAIRVTFSQTQSSYILPATHEASSRTDVDLPPMGLRLRLRADFDISGLSGQARVIAVALQQYGFIVADNGSNWFFQGAPSPGWDDDDLSQLKNIPGTAFEVVETGPAQS